MAYPLQGQENERAGFWIGFGLGAGVNLSQELDGEVLGGGGGYVRLGLTANRHLLVGFQGIGWVRDQDDETLARGQ